MHKALNIFYYFFNLVFFSLELVIFSLRLLIELSKLLFFANSDLFWYLKKELKAQMDKTQLWVFKYP